MTGLFKVSIQTIKNQNDKTHEKIKFSAALTLIAALIVLVVLALPSSASTGAAVDVVNKGDTVQISIDLFTGMEFVSWSCTPYGALSFDTTTQSGDTYTTEATAVKLGTVTVNAVVKMYDGSTSTTTVDTIQIVLEGGIYRVRNDMTDELYPNNPFYLRSQATYETSTTPIFVAQHSQNDFGDMSNRIYNHWRFEHLGNGEYVIQNMADENKVLTYFSDNSTVSLSVVGDSITDSQKWYITGENIIPVSAPTKCLVLASPQPSGTYYDSGTPYYYFNLRANTIATMSFENWSFEKENIKQILFKEIDGYGLTESFTVSYTLDEGTVDFAEHGYELKPYHFENPNMPTITWYSSNHSVATVDSTGKLTLNGTGRTTITVRGEYAPGTEFAYGEYILDVKLKYETYFIKNIETDLHAGAESASLSSGMEVEQQSFDGDSVQRWGFTWNDTDGTYSIINEGSPSGLPYYLGIENDTLSDGADIVLRTGNVTDGMKWLVQDTDNGYKIVSCLDPDEEYVLKTSSSSATEGQKLVLGVYQNDTSYRDEWKIQPFLYGVQTFREETSTNVNCHGYAMMRNDAPEDWHPLTDEYIDSIILNENTGNNDYSDIVRENISKNTKSDFETWLNLNGYIYTPESSFYGNGDNTTLAPNQYRIVLRTGFHNFYDDDYDNALIIGYYDYHFWYQTYDGCWANKHGKNEEAELLPEGVTPFSTNTSGWSDGYYQNFYDGEIYSYIITIE